MIAKEIRQHEFLSLARLGQKRYVEDTLTATRYPADRPIVPETRSSSGETRPEKGWEDGGLIRIVV